MSAAGLSKDGSDWLPSSMNHVITVGPIVSQVPFSASRNICIYNPLNCHIDMLSIYKKKKNISYIVTVDILKIHGFPPMNSDH